MCSWLSGNLWLGLPLVALLSLGSYLGIRYLALPAARGAIRASRATWDDILVAHKVLHRFSLIGPAVILRFGLECAASGLLGEILVVTADVILILGGVWVLGAVFGALNDMYARLDIARSRPIKAYLQLLELGLWILAVRGSPRHSVSL